MRYNGNLVDADGTVGRGVGFERIRRITGYLVGGLDRFNNGKAAEQRDRVKHVDFTEWTPESRDAMAARGL